MENTHIGLFSYFLLISYSSTTEPSMTEKMSISNWTPKKFAVYDEKYSQFYSC